MSEHPGHIVIEDVRPSLDCGRHPVKRVTGETFAVEATIYRDGPDVIRAVVRWRKKGEFSGESAGKAQGAESTFERPMIQVNAGLDRWRGELALDRNTRYLYTVEAWSDPFATWVEELRRKVAGGRTDLASEIAEGRSMLDSAAGKGEAGAGPDEALLRAAAATLRARRPDPAACLGAVDRPEVLAAMVRLQERKDRSMHVPELEVIADRPRARFGSWYELFVRSQGASTTKSGTFEDAERRLPDIRDMGFDVIYLAPIHPIGKTNRKGRNNALKAGPGDPGSPWAIGNEHGGHTAIEPALGTLADFDRFQSAVREHGMELALDFAIQASPDHPWVKRHPQWFKQRPDGTIKYAENPPKKYEDIHPIDFDTIDWKALWQALRETVEFWVERGVRIFRVDNPHTKPIPFWNWLIEGIQSHHPDVIFLAEAFTRPTVMNGLAKAGFSQSYTYFTWRNTKSELTEYMEQLTTSGMEEFFRPNFFANTPDILPEFLQHGGRPAFEIRAILAGTLSPSWGIYSGYELCENAAVAPGREDYLDSEKYQIKPRDWDAPGNIKNLISRVNAIRQENPALHELANLRFLPADNEHILFFAKSSGDGSNVILVVVNLDPHQWHECTVQVPLEEIGVRPDGRFQVQDLLTGEHYYWGQRNYVRLDPADRPAHILRVEARS